MTKKLQENVVARIDRDYLHRKWSFKPTHIEGHAGAEGSEWTLESIRASTGMAVDLSSDTTHKVRFRLLDDDNEVYYGGWLLDDADCAVQDAVLEWGKRDSGCTTIQVKDTDGKWRQDIG